MRKVGKYKKLGSVSYFTPDPLPPKNPDLIIDDQMIALYAQAISALEKLNAVAQYVPSVERFLKAYSIKEAVLSCSIEGIHTTILDIFTQPVSAHVSKNVKLVINYTKALYKATDLLRSKEFPLVQRVIREIHKELMEDEQGGTSFPGAYRQQSVSVGSLVPPQAPDLNDLMSHLEQYINSEHLFPLISVGLVHAQFEMIHPFLDGNGRVGRLLIVLMLMEYKLLEIPLLYPSYYFKKHHAEYYHRLSQIHEKGDFEGWIIYFLTTIYQGAVDAFARIQALRELEESLQVQLQNSESLTTTQKELCLQAVVALYKMPVFTISDLADVLNISYNTAAKIMFVLQAHMIIEIQNKEQKRNKMYIFKRYLDILDENL